MADHDKKNSHGSLPDHHKKNSHGSLSEHHNKIHPLQDPEAPPAQQHNNPTAPLVPPGSSTSDQPDAPLQRTIPYQPLKPPKKRRSCCCRCLCWTLCLLLLLVIAIAATLGILYLVFRPKIPDYSVDRLQLTQFGLGPDSSLTATFNVTITAKNPNKKIGIYYEDGSHVSVWFTDTKLSEGSMPEFYQGHKNTTVLYLEMKGQTRDANGLMMRIQEQQQATGNLPLKVRVNQPVRVKLGALKLMEVKFKVRCNLLVDNLSAENDINIQDSSCKFRLEL